MADYFDVNPEYGTLEDFDRLLARAHELRLKVLAWGRRSGSAGETGRRGGRCLAHAGWLALAVDVQAGSGESTLARFRRALRERRRLGGRMPDRAEWLQA